MKKIVFLDLEDTVIDVFSPETGDRNCELVNIAETRAFLERECPDEVRLFSFALWSEQRVAQFCSGLEARLNEALGIELNVEGAFVIRTLFQLCRKNGLMFEDDNECMLFHSKDLGFQQFITLSDEFSDVEVVLLDDAVLSKRIEIPSRNLTIRIVNVNDIL
jgi:hypothetical protein